MTDDFIWPVATFYIAILIENPCRNHIEVFRNFVCADWQYQRKCTRNQFDIKLKQFVNCDLNDFNQQLSTSSCLEPANDTRPYLLEFQNKIILFFLFLLLLLLKTFEH